MQTGNLSYSVRQQISVLHRFISTPIKSGIIYLKNQSTYKNLLSKVAQVKGTGEEVQAFYDLKQQEIDNKAKEKEEKARLKAEKAAARESIVSRVRKGPKTRGGFRRGVSSVRTLRPDLDLELSSTYFIETPSTSNLDSPFESLAPACKAIPIKINGHENIVDEVQHLQTDLLVDDCVIVSYETKLFPGKVKEINLFTDSPPIYKVSCMARKGKKWVWPEKSDEVWYELENIVKKICEENIIVINKRGMYDVKERLLYSEDEYEF